MLWFVFAFGVNSMAFAEPKANECDSVVSDLLQRKKEALDRRERTIRVKENDLDAASKRLQSQLSDLTAMRDDMREQMKAIDAEQEKLIRTLVDMFRNMRGKQAAGILELTADSIAMAVLKRLPPDRGGAILAAMNSKRASELTEKMGSRP